MAVTVAQSLPGAPRKNLAAQLATGERAHKPLVSAADDRASQVLGRVIDDALRASDITKQQASHLMGYGSNQAPISNWIAGRENPQLSRLWKLGPAFRANFVIGLAQACEDIEIRTVLTVNRKASA